ncbi:MAG TPA: BTAD domain-containing putative transcriptional regulator [Gemmatimonadaceae bacterium]|nr:BTAD domain-containing putative transcriptional regulator [Gemmatimonadaceae bacterium]
MLSLQLFGGCTLRSDGAPLDGPVVQRRRLALLALIACSKSPGLSRDKLTAYFWPEEERERARHFLADSLFTIRKAVGRDVLLSSGSDISVNVDVIDVDVRRFEDLVAHGDFASAITLYRGPFLDGFFISDAPEFDRWADSERDRLSTRYGMCLESLAQQHEDRGDHSEAAQWWTRLASHDPYSARVALRTMHALESTGDSAAAILHAAKYQKLIRDDLDLAPDPEVAALSLTLRSGSVTRSSESKTFERATAAPSVISTPDLPIQNHASTGQPDSPANSRKIRTPWPERRYAIAAAILLIAGSVGAFGLSKSKSEKIGPSPNQSMKASSSTGVTSVNARVSARHDAEDFYSQGRYLTQSSQDEDRYVKALALYNRAIERDSTFARAYAGMADVYNYMDDPRRARESAMKALSLDSTMAEAFNALAYVYAYYDHNWLAGDSAVERATRLSPRFTLAHLRRAGINAVLGRADVAFASLEKARSIEPESWLVLYNRALVAGTLGMTDEAIRHFEAAAALEPNRKDLRTQLAWNYWTAGRKVEAIALLRSLGDEADAAILSGEKADLETLIHHFETDSSMLTTCQAVLIYSVLGNKDAAFTQIERGLRHNRFLPMQIRSPLFAWLKDDPRYGQLMSELGLAGITESQPRTQTVARLPRN